MKYDVDTMDILNLMRKQYDANNNNIHDPIPKAYCTNLNESFNTVKF